MTAGCTIKGLTVNDWDSEKMQTLDQASIDVDCPQCRFANSVRWKEVRMRSAVICRGCKTTLKLEDCMNSFRRAERTFSTALNELESAIAGFNIELKITL